MPDHSESGSSGDGVFTPDDLVFEDSGAGFTQPSGLADGTSALPDRERPAPAWVTYSLTALNITTGCAAFAVGKQIFNPANLNMQAPKEAEGLPSWFANRYASGRVVQAAMRTVVKDTGVLMGASAVWYGLAAALRALRGVDDPWNNTVSGCASSSLIGALFFDSFSRTRVTVFGVVGAAMGNWGFRQREVLEQRLLDKQRELEQKHLGVAPEALHQHLDLRLLRRLLRLEEAGQMDQLKRTMEEHQKLAQAEGNGGNDWPGIMRAAPWLQQQQQQQQQQQKGPSATAGDAQQAQAAEEVVDLQHR